jgi:rubredoxin
MCLICGWIYDEEAGLPEEGIAPAPAGTMCPSTGPARNAAPARKISRWSPSDRIFDLQ